MLEPGQGIETSTEITVELVVVRQPPQHLVIIERPLRDQVGHVAPIPERTEHFSEPLLAVLAGYRAPHPVLECDPVGASQRLSLHR